LCAAKVPEESLSAFVAEVNSHPGVTHNYLRNHEYNIWFTCIGPSWEAICSFLEEITRKTGIPVLNLSATRLYKIKVNFQME
jgi:DNA-binding Lrp family transcriptional regulator